MKLHEIDFSKLAFWRSQSPTQQHDTLVEDPLVRVETEIRQRVQDLDRSSVLLALIHAGDLVLTSRDIETLGTHLHDTEEPQSIVGAMTSAGMFASRGSLRKNVTAHPVLVKTAFLLEEDEQKVDIRLDSATPTVILPLGMQKAEPLFRGIDTLRRAEMIEATPYGNLLVYGVTADGKKHAEVLQARTELLQVQPLIVIGRDKITAGEYSFPIGNPLLPSAPQADR